ncbi:MAG: pyrroline-5-carboxylate reductase [Gammaproteobacteria bacterium]|nr:pyrroline-5-carboxylate reductase [Gammaproteobacteria bacterium]
MKDNSIGFIGAGNMANSLIRGLLAKGVSPDRLIAADIDTTKLETLASDCGVRTASAQDIAATADVLILAVKPQVMEQACRPLCASLQSRQSLVVSIAAGITIAHLQDWLGRHVALVRCMPNTPALVGKGATGLYANKKVSSEQKALAEEILGAVGLALWLDSEAAIDAVTALSGSGPAYFFLFMEAMQETAVNMGLDEETARKLTYQTATGAAALAASSDLSTAELRRQVTSPGGTTEQALNQFEQGGLRNLVQKALLAAQRRSRELSE